MHLRDLILNTRFRQNDFLKLWLPEMVNQLTEKNKGRGHTPLHIAAMTGHGIALEFLLQLTSRPAVTIQSDDFKNTPLLWSIANCTISASLTLLDYNYVPDQAEMRAQINQPCEDGNTPLILSVAKGWHHQNDQSYVIDKRPQSVVASRLLELGADVHSKNTYGCTALHYACLHRDIAAIHRLMAQGANLFERNIEGQTAFELLSSNYEQAREAITLCCSSAHTLNKDYWNQNSIAWQRFDKYRRQLASKYGIENLSLEQCVQQSAIKKSQDFSFFSACSPNATLVGATVGAVIGVGLSVLTGGVTIILIAAGLGCLAGLIGYMLYSMNSDSSPKESSLNFCL